MYKLLIADDEYEFRNGLTRFFPWNQVGFEAVKQAENGKEILDIVLTNEIDVILCDIKMPILSGIDVARELRHSHIKIVFLSGYREFEYAQQALTFGVKNYILKPPKFHELENVFKGLKEELDQKKDLSASQLTSEKEEGPVFETLISRIKRYIEQNYRDATLEGTAKFVHLNQHYLSKYFKQKTSENFSDYVIRVKMEKAKELLADRNSKTYEISEMVGYSNAKNFTRMFRKYTGKSPREYRNQE
ncbi:response regulator transcription factor [Brevibacillus sp. NRS-1366]|uniref:response regulator transcription factor n=1 Tax=Brevibacillus sp. NRS-1366 TaxID=3233899 RepID=UPI003D2591C7